MRTKHIHAEVIKAWADGEVIQFWLESELMWLDVVENRPTWEKHVKYRVKPENIVALREVRYDLSTQCVYHFGCPSKANIKYEFTPEGKLVSVEML